MSTIDNHRALRIAVTTALRTGVLPRPSACESCGKAAKTTGRTGLVYHHHDYSKPLDVIPLCCSCHRLIHFGKLVEPRTGRMYPPRRIVRTEASKRRSVQHYLKQGRTWAHGISRADFARISADLQREQLSA